jgi:hypothetical protein
MKGEQIQKIFGIGLGRTGGTSLSKAMSMLGYKCKHAPAYIDEITKYEFISDIFIAARYEFLDYAFPKARFIMTVRDIESWIKSCSKYKDPSKPNGILNEWGIQGTTLRSAENRFRLFGISYYDEKVFRYVHSDYYYRVLTHFRNRHDKLLVLNICNGEGWKELCSFLGKEVPDVAFPHKNKAWQQ